MRCVLRGEGVEAHSREKEKVLVLWNSTVTREGLGWGERTVRSPQAKTGNAGDKRGTHKGLEGSGRLG